MKLSPRKIPNIRKNFLKINLKNSTKRTTMGKYKEILKIMRKKTLK